jgi:hypothetical protein
VIRATVAVAARPGLWLTAVRQARRTAAPGWWKRRPFLPLPSREYVRFRLLTQYGAADATPSGRDLVTYLEWCKRYG